jgi:hypothetical protein
MCVDPATITATAAVAGTALSVVGKTTQYADNSRLYIENGAAANRSLATTYNSLQTKMIQEGDAAATESFDVVRGLAEAKGKATAAAGEAGVEGVSFSNILSDFEAREGRARGNIDANYQMAVGQGTNEMEAARNRAKAQINSTPIPSEGGLYASIGADLFKGGLKIYEAFEDQGPGKGNKTKTSPGVA